VPRVAEGIGPRPPARAAFLRAGLGCGGSCFPKDSLALKQLAGNSGYHFQLLNAVIEVNELQKRRVVQKLQQHLGTLRGKRDRAARARVQAEHRRHARGAVRIIAYRLLAEGRRGAGVGSRRASRDLEEVEICDSVLAAVRDADAAVIVTEWPQLRELTTAEVRDAMARPLIVDGRNLLDPAAAAAAGFEYEGIGRPTHSTPDRELQS
jgi:UDPglucose 6-dehydrogenase